MIVFLLGTVPISSMLNTYERSAELTSIDVMNFPFALIDICFLIQIGLAGWRLAFSPRKVLDLLITAPPGLAALRNVLASAFGIHPNCRLIPTKWRRLVSKSLFILSSTVFGAGLNLIILYFLIPDAIVSYSPVTCFRSLWDPLSGLWEPANPFVLSSCLRGFGIVITIAILIAIGAGTRYLARQLTRVGVEHLATTDRRSPILFLRSFLDDQIRLKRPRRLFFRWLLGLGEPAPTLDHLLVEEGTSLGPVVAVGVPGSPPPFGAARTYLDDDEWHTGVAQFARAATAIIIVADDTDGVIWELSHIREAGHSHKTLYYLPPRLAEPMEAKRIIQREVMAGLPARFDARKASDKLAHLRRPCVGWFQDTKGQFYFLTTAYPSRASYSAAFRVAFARHNLSASPHLTRARSPSAHAAHEGAPSPIDERYSDQSQGQRGGRRDPC
jgi:hypothetical protein